MEQEISFWKHMIPKRGTRTGFKKFCYYTIFFGASYSTFVALAGAVVALGSGVWWLGGCLLVASVFLGRVAWVALDRGTDLSVYGSIQRKR
jgi:hypothetical protein